MSTTNIWVSGLFGLMFISTGCATTTPYISNGLAAQIAATPSPFHKFTYIRAYEDEEVGARHGDVYASHVKRSWRYLPWVY